MQTAFASGASPQAPKSELTALLHPRIEGSPNLYPYQGNSSDNSEDSAAPCGDAMCHLMGPHVH